MGIAPKKNTLQAFSIHIDEMTAPGETNTATKTIAMANRLVVMESRLGGFIAAGVFHIFVSGWY